MKEYKLLDSLKRDFKQLVEEVIKDKFFQLGSLITVDLKYKNINILDMVQIKINRTYPYYRNQDSLLRIGRWSINCYLGNRGYECAKCGHPIKLHEARSTRVSCGIFGDIEESCCVYCIIPRTG